MKHHCAEPDRYTRQGFPEAVYAPGKTIEQLVEITKNLCKGEGPVIITRLEENIFKALKKKIPQIKYNKLAKIAIAKELSMIGCAEGKSSDEYICVVTAGTTDIPVAEEAAVTAEVLKNKVLRIYDVGVAGVHRLLEHKDILLNASCVIVCAGMEGALASVVGGIARCPVIGVPTSVGYGASFNGIASLLSMLNSCAANVSVVNIDDGFGAGIIAGIINKQAKKGI